MSLPTYNNEHCSVPDDFPFPFEPYEIQKQFMINLYKALEEGRIGIFESPTGTGKSLSIICGSLKWLQDHENQKRKELEDKLKQIEEDKERKTNDSTDWFESYSKQKEESSCADEIKTTLNKYKKIEDKIRKIKETSKLKKTPAFTSETSAFNALFPKADPHQFEIADKTLFDSSFDEDDAIIVKEYNSDEDPALSDDEEKEAEDKNPQTKIFFCSRTHSQLTQFVREIQKTPFSEDIRVVTMASRQNLCINEAVQKLKNVNFMNNQCLNLQKQKKGKGTKMSMDETLVKKKKTGSGCPYYKTNAIENFKNSLLVEIQDIEELVSTGKKLKACPYYVSRYAVPDAQLIVLPYNTLLHKPTRDACGISLKGNIVIIDEAHNLLEAIANIHSTEVTGQQLGQALSQLSQYQDRYRTRLKAKNIMYINQLIFILKAFINQLKGSTTKLLSLNNFLCDSAIDNINLYKLLLYCKQSEISKKLNGFVEKYNPPEELKKEIKPTSLNSVSSFLKELSNPKVKINSVPETKEKGASVPVLSSPLLQIEEFLHALTNLNKDGRIVISIHETFNLSRIKFLLLNPSSYFEQIIQDCRSVIVAGGTMQPISEFRDQLFIAAGAPFGRIMHFSCDHIIPPENLLSIALSNGPTGKQFDFSFKNRTSVEMIDELGRLLINIVNIVPGGLVCFFVSYEYEKFVFNHWKKSGVLSCIEKRKKLFREPKVSSEVEKLLAEYAAVIHGIPPGSKDPITGAILFSVVGGKMSEGINFSDNLGRCIIMAGLPYANIKSPELQEKINFLNTTVSKSPEGISAGQIYYENLCIKAVNQSIGRAIRHQKDYATILLLDMRYHSSKIISGLPKWISSNLQIINKFGLSISSIARFFSSKKKL